MRSGRSVVVALALVAASPSPAARADDQRADLLSIQAGDVAVTSENCQYTPVSVTWALASGVTVFTAFAELHRGGQVVARQDLARSGSYFWCPLTDGVGHFTLGPATQVNGYDDRFHSFLFGDDTTGAFDVKYASRVGLSVVRRGSTVTLTSATTRYSLDSSSYVPWSPPATAIQYLSGGRWTTLRTLGPSNRVTLTFRQGVVRTYRVVTTSSTTVWGATSDDARG